MKKQAGAPSEAAPSEAAALPPGTLLRPIGYVELFRRRPSGASQAEHVPHGYTYEVVAEGRGVPPWDMTRKKIRADVALRHRDRFEVVADAASGAPTENEAPAGGPEGA
jgi:hypothetical protein